MKVNGTANVESILDPGSQIIAMSEAVCLDLGLIYDPTIRLNMESGNGQINPSLGLARNVPCKIGDMTLVLQIHVVRSPAYDILLGRPFDVLTESTVPLSFRSCPFLLNNSLIKTIIPDTHSRPNDPSN